MKTTLHDLFPETLLVSREGDHIYTTSLKVAEHFGKRHTNVLRAIENLFGDVFAQPNFGPSNEPKFWLVEEFRRLNFEPATYLDAQKKPREMCKLTHDGFAYLCMGFTGSAAAVWKLKFLAAFRDMERQLRAGEARYAAALDQVRPYLRRVVEATESGQRRAAIAGPLGKSPASITYHRRSARRLGLLRAA